MVPLLEEKMFFKKKANMTKKDLSEVCSYAKYEVIEAGETVYKQGDLPDKCYIILKGQVMVQIPDPSGEGLVVPKLPTEVEPEVVKPVEDENKDKILTAEELAALPIREQRKYKTRLMLQDILSTQNVKRATLSVNEAIN